MQICEHLLTLGWFCTNNFIKVTLTFHVHNHPRKMLHQERLNSNICERGAHNMEVFASNKLKETCYPTCHPWSNFDSVVFTQLKVVQLLCLFDGGFRMTECPYCKTHGSTWSHILINIATEYGGNPWNRNSPPIVLKFSTYICKYLKLWVLQFSQKKIQTSEECPISDRYTLMTCPTIWLLPTSS